MTALQCFEASARHLSFTKAAQELHITQSAVSKQVAQLEDMIKCSLFERTSQSLYLTPIGKKYYLEVQKILQHVERATIDVMAHGADTQTLSIISHPTFCAKWLIPALKGFGRAYPNIHLDVKELTNPFFSEDCHCDVAFLYGNGAWKDMHAVRLFDEEMVAVCSPEYLGEGLVGLDEIERYTLIQSNARPSAWYHYFEAQKVSVSSSLVGPRFETFYACISAAVLGCGIALVPKIMVQTELLAGSLVQAWHYVHKEMGGYYVAYPYDKARTSRVQCMLAWIERHKAQSASLLVV